MRAVAEKVTAARPRDAAGQLLAETWQARAWDRAALLNTGRTANDVINGADLDTLHALSTELPTYLAAQHTKPQGFQAVLEFTEPDPAHVLRAVDDALADRVPAPQGWALRARLDLDALEPLTGLRRETDGTADDGNALRTAVAARLADQQARRFPP